MIRQDDRAYDPTTVRQAIENAGGLWNVNKYAHRVRKYAENHPEVSSEDGCIFRSHMVDVLQGAGVALDFDNFLIELDNVWNSPSAIARRNRERAKNGEIQDVRKIHSVAP